MDNGSPSCRRRKSGEGENRGKGKKKCGEGRRGEGRRASGVGLLESPKPSLGVPVSENGETGVGNAGFEFF